MYQIILLLNENYIYTYIILNDTHPNIYFLLKVLFTLPRVDNKVNIQYLIVNKIDFLRKTLYVWRLSSNKTVYEFIRF